MKELKSSVGIDISKDSFEVCIKQLLGERVVIKATHSFQNSFTEFDDFLKWTLRKVSPVYHRLAVLSLAKAFIRYGEWRKSATVKINKTISFSVYHC